MRGSGAGAVVVSGRRIRFDYAFLYSRPRWLRLDVKPSVGAAGASFTALGIVDGLCARAYLPHESVEIQACFEDSLTDALALDPAAFLLGCPDVSLLERLEDATIAREHDSVTVGGRFSSRRVTVVVDPSLGVVNALHVADDDGKRIASLSYEDHGRVGGRLIPRDIKIEVFEGTRRESSIELRHSSLKVGGEVARGEYTYEIPPGVQVLSWEELRFEEDQ
jgi:hypothetical protein